MKLGKSASASPPSHQRLCGSVSGCGSAESNCEWGSARKTVRSTVRVSFSSSFIQANSWQGETSYQSRLLLEERGRKRAPNRNIISVVTISSATNRRTDGATTDAVELKPLTKIVWRCSERDSRSIGGRRVTRVFAKPEPQCIAVSGSSEGPSMNDVCQTLGILDCIPLFVRISRIPSVQVFAK